MEDIELGPPLRAAIEALESLGIDYYVFGGNAQNVWGQPRFTRDGDVVIHLPDDRIEALLNEAARRGFEVDPQRHLQRMKSNRMVRLPFDRILVDFVLGETDFEASAMKRRQRITYLGIAMWVATAEDLILHKLIARRPIDLADIEKVIRRNRSTLDRAYLRKWARWLAEATGFDAIETTRRDMMRRFGTRRVGKP